MIAPGDRYIYVEEGDQWRVVILLKFVIECLDTINCSVTDGEADAAINLLGSLARKKFLGYTVNERAVLQYSPDRTTFTIQLASFF